MENTKLIFLGSRKSETQEHELQLYYNDRNEIYIKITIDDNYTFICLDRATAIKLHKELKKQISYIEIE